MKQTLLMEKYPVYSMVLPKNETSRQSVDEIIDYLKEHIEAHPIARYIATFDHYRHTLELPESSIDEDILDAKDIVFCFGLAIPNAEVLAIRPRSIGVAERHQDFVISFLEAPMPMANSAMETWARGLMDLAV